MTGLRVRRTWVVVCAGLYASAVASISWAQVCGNHIIEGDEQCDDGNTFGGDGCASNCTIETTRTLNLSSPPSLSLIQGLIGVYLSFPRSTPMKLTIGASRASDPSGRIPVVIKDSDYVFTTNVAGTIDCEVGYATGEFGPHVAGAGYIGCGDAGLPDVDYLLSQDHNINDVDPTCATGTPDISNPVVCNGPLTTTYSGGRGKGAAVIQMRIAVYEAFSQPTCSPTSPDISQAPQDVIFTTGIASAQILDANNMSGSAIAPGAKCGPSACTASATGAAFDCSSLPGDPMTPISGAALAGVAITLDDLFIDDYVTVFTRDPAGALNTPGPTFPAAATSTPTPSMHAVGTATPSPTATPKPSASATASPQPTSTLSPTRTVAATATSSATLSPTLTAASTSTATLVPPSATPTPSAAPSAIFTATPSSTSNPVASPTPIQGFSICDVNQDHEVNAADLTALIEALFTPGALQADVNVDGATTVADVVSLNQRVASGGCSG